ATIVTASGPAGCSARILPTARKGKLPNAASSVTGTRSSPIAPVLGSSIDDVPTVVASPPVSSAVSGSCGGRIGPGPKLAARGATLVWSERRQRGPGQGAKRAWIGHPQPMSNEGMGRGGGVPAARELHHGLLDVPSTCTHSSATLSAFEQPHAHTAAPT